MDTKINVAFGLNTSFRSPSFSTCQFTQSSLTFLTCLSRIITVDSRKISRYSTTPLHSQNSKSVRRGSQEIYWRRKRVLRTMYTIFSIEKNRRKPFFICGDWLLRKILLRFEQCIEVVSRPAKPGHISSINICYCINNVWLDTAYWLFELTADIWVWTELKIFGTKLI